VEQHSEEAPGPAEQRPAGPIRVGQALGEALVDLGVGTFFGVLGSGNFAVTRAAVQAGARFFHARHECASVCMADAYARVSGRVGVATVHQGPGLTNAATGLAEAAKAGTPLLLLAAATSASAVRSNFRIDQGAVAVALGAAHERVASPETAVEDLQRAYQRAVVERCAVLVDLPLDVQAAALPTAAVPAPAPVELLAPAPAPEAVSAAADLLAASRRPVVIAGRGAVVAGAGPALEALAARIGALLATSANGHGLFSGNPFALGIAGGFAAPTAAALLREADAVLAVGASLNMWTTRHGSLIDPAARVVQVDLDPRAIGAHRRVELGVVGDAARSAQAIDAELARRGHRATGARSDELAARIAAGRWRDIAGANIAGAEMAGAGINGAATEADPLGRIDPRTLSIALDELLPAERTVVVDSGHFMGWLAMYLDVPDAAGFVFPQAFQSVGLGLGAALGAAVARPDRLTIAALGDGGLLMSLGELESAVRLALPLLVVVYNDAAYGAEVHHFALQGQPVDLVQFDDVDFAALGRAAGGEGATVRTVEDLAAVSRWLPRRERPLVVDAKIRPDIVAEWLAEAFTAH